MSQVASRKRPAPGTSPVQWNENGSPIDITSYTDPSETLATNLYHSMASQPTRQSPSNQLARRPANNHMVARNPYGNGGSEGWTGAIDSLPQQPSSVGWVPPTDEEKLDQDASQAMEAGKKARKQIPPFVQKLRSFLDEERNTDLIRWSNIGDSFIVLDEEEFARTMIPELFKHSNYASFVRQLNMYGFHKKVGLSDNSMRASERKNKSPSEYTNAYFKRGKPNLMWLIQKPKTQGKGKAGAKGKSNDANGDEDEIYDMESQQSVNQGIQERGVNQRNPHQSLMIGQGENALAQEELAALHQEMRTIRHQHQVISEVLHKIKRDHEQQAVAYQELHNRHENSINAILTFLATVYNRSLEGHGNQNMANLFNGTLPHDIAHQGSVVDVGDFNSRNDNVSNEEARRPSRRPPLLLKAPPPDDTGSNGMSPDTMASAASPSAPQTARSQARAANTVPKTSHQGRRTIEEIYDQDSATPSAPSPQFDFNGNARVGLPERDIMSFINSANEKDADNQFVNRMDFPQALSHLQTADGQSPLSPHERNGVLQLMANENAHTNANGSTNNALTSPNPPDMPIPNMDDWKSSNDDFAFLERTLREQDENMNRVSNQLSPLSPSGGIPGLNNTENYAQSLPNDSLDFDQIFDTRDYFGDTNNVSNISFGNEANEFTNGGDFTFDNPLGDVGVDGIGNNVGHEQGPGRIVETVNSSEATSPANTVEEYTGQEEMGSPRKRRRRN